MTVDAASRASSVDENVLVMSEVQEIGHPGPTQ